MNARTPTNQDPFPQPISKEIWERKYKLTTPNPDIQDDMSVQDTWNRIAEACARVIPTHYDKDGAIVDHGLSEDEIEKLYHERKDNFAYALEDFKFLPAGRITSGAGSARQVTLFNCFVMGVIPDSLDGIFDMLKEAALTMQQGGGIGYDFSTIRPSGAPVKGVESDASGPLSFMDVWDAMCRTIMSAGSRRGAMMATMRCDHPDVFNFIKAKRTKGRLNMFNMSVLITDEFMYSVEYDLDWSLHFNGVEYKTVRARDLWNEIIDNTYNHAEPGVIFIDRINKENNLWEIENITATNPCGEQPLPPYGACLLGSLNLTRFVDNSFTSNAYVNLADLRKVAGIATEMLDSVVDMSNFPLPAQREEALMKRRMGLGITGLADMLLMLGIEYGSVEAQSITSRIMANITIESYRRSITLASKFGACPAVSSFDQRKSFLQSGFMSKMDSSLRDDIMQNGIRNTHLTSIAPTGTISMYAGNVSSGIEPIFATSYNRKVLADNGTDSTTQLVEDYAILKWREHCEFNGLDVQDPPALVTAQTLSVEDHLVMQASVQKWIDSSISKTINCPEDISFEAFKDVYVKAYHMGLKGCTTYRPNDTLGTVLSITEEPKSEPEKKEEAPEIISPTVTGGVMDRPEVLDGETFKLKWPGNAHAIYVTLSDIRDEHGLRPFEIFINSKNMEHFAWTVALTRMISAVFRRGGSVGFVVDELKAVFDPRGGVWMKGQYVPSILAAIGNVIEQHMLNIGYLVGPETSSIVEGIQSEPVEIESVTRPAGKTCGSCGGFNIVKEAGCEVCKDCGNSACG